MSTSFCLQEKGRLEADAGRRPVIPEHAQNVLLAGKIPAHGAVLPQVLLKLNSLILATSSSLSTDLSFFLLHLFIPPNPGLTPPGTYNPNARGSDACRGSN